jgi:integrase
MARGSVIHRANADGSTTWDIKYRDAAGRQVKRKVARVPAGEAGGRRLAEAELNKALAEAGRGARHVTVRNRETFTDYATRWHRESVKPRLEPNTSRAYDVDLRLRLVPFFGAKPLPAITRSDVHAYVAHRRRESKDSAKTINNSLIVLRVMLGHAVEDGLVAENVAAGRGARDRLKLPVAHREMDYLRLDEIPDYLGACSAKYRLLAEVLIGAGLRIGEATALVWGDVDWRSGGIVVRRSAKRQGTGSTKTDSARRVEIGPRLLALLADRQAAHAEHGDTLGQLILPGRDGGLLDRSKVSTGWHKQALKAAGLRQTIRLHDLRHSAAAGWLAAGLPMVYVQRQLGHTTIATTANLYAHLEESFLRGAAARAEAAIWESGTTVVPNGEQ